MTGGPAAIASLLSRHLDRPVIDRTGVSGSFDIELEAAEIKAAPDYKPGPSDLALPPAAGPTIFVPFSNGSDSSWSQSSGRWR